MEIKFIDLFAGIGGMRLGLENAIHRFNFQSNCVFTSEIKQHAIKVYQDNFRENYIHGDISQISSLQIPDFDILLAGFPCQPFSTAGTRQGFLDTRGTLFFEIERILQDKKPFGFLLENVDNVVKHDRGRTLKTIIHNLEKLNYQVVWKVLNAKDFGIPQDRKRIYLELDKLLFVRGKSLLIRLNIVEIFENLKYHFFHKSDKSTNSLLLNFILK